MIIAFLFVCILLVLGVAVRQRSKIFQWTYIPASVIAGFIGLGIIQLGMQSSYVDYEVPATVKQLSDPELATSITSDRTIVHNRATDLSDVLKSWPGFLIAVVFAGMLLTKPGTGSAKDDARQSAKRVGRQGLMVWIIVLGETAVGLLATWLLVQPWYELPNSAGMLIETGFAGGHGTAGAMGEVFSHPNVNLAGGRDLGMLMATCGLVFGVVSGIMWINLGVRFGWVDSIASKHGQSNEISEPIGHARVSPDSMDPLLFQLLWLALAFAVGMVMQAIVLHFAGLVDGWFASDEVVEGAQKELSKRLQVSSIADFPLFIYTLFGGLIVRWAMGLLGYADRIDAITISRLTGSAMDVLVVAAIASLNLQAIASMLVPFTILFACGCVWAAVCLLVISKWVLPSDRWFQLGLINYGMSTGTTATGFVLLRMIDPKLQSGAAEDYALAAPLSAPFIGGGMITIALPLLVLEEVWIGIPAALIALIVVGLICVGRWVRPASENTQETRP